MDQGNSQPTMALDLEKLIQRCFEECKRTKLISTGMIVNEQELVKHIAKTIIGELYELEICRRIAPIFREIERLGRDFAYLEGRDKMEQNMLNLRIGPTPDR